MNEALQITEEYFHSHLYYGGLGRLGAGEDEGKNCLISVNHI